MNNKIITNLAFYVNFSKDPPRKEVPQAIKDCRTAGFCVTVITGDNKNTFEAIRREIGVFGRLEDISSRSLTGKEFIELPDRENTSKTKWRASILSG